MSNEELISFIKKNPIGIGCGVLSLALLGGWYYRGLDLPDVETEVGQKQAESERYTANLARATQLKEQFDALQTATKEIDGRLVRAGDLGKNTNYFYKLEADSGAKLLDARQIPLPPRKEANKTAYVAVPFSITVQGDFNQLLDYVRRLENGSHYCRVLGANCLVLPDRSQPLTATLNLELLGLP